MNYESHEAEHVAAESYFFKRSVTLASLFKRRSDLSELIYRLKTTHGLASASNQLTAAEIGQIDSVACELSRLHDSLPDVFVAYAREEM
jgi:hypothetical protein